MYDIDKGGKGFSDSRHFPFLLRESVSRSEQMSLKTYVYRTGQKRHFLKKITIQPWLATCFGHDASRIKSNILLFPGPCPNPSPT